MIIAVKCIKEVLVSG